MKPVIVDRQSSIVDQYGGPFGGSDLECLQITQLSVTCKVTVPATYTSTAMLFIRGTNHDGDLGDDTKTVIVPPVWTGAASSVVGGKVQESVSGNATVTATWTNLPKWIRVFFDETGGPGYGNGGSVDITVTAW